MTVRFNVDGVAGVAAIYTGDDDLPMSDPLSHVDRLKFHSGLHNIAIVSVHTGLTILPAVAPASYNRQPHTLFAHGKAGVPYVEGRITSFNGVARSTPLVGSIALAQQSGVEHAAFPRIVHLGANATNVILNEASVAHQEQWWSAMSVGWEVYVTDVLLPDGPPASPPQPGVMVDITENRVVLGEGRFDTERRYIRSGAPGSNFEMQHLSTWTLSRGASNDITTSWRNTTGPSHALQRQVAGHASVFFNASYTLAKL